jgi:ribA/ribD-fused uncharacterized protein
MINSFKGDYAFLSNMYEFSPIELDIGVITSSEALYQASKAKNLGEFKYILAMGPYESKRYAKTMDVREDWHDIKLNVMKLVVTIKFQFVSGLGRMLLDTGDVELIEGNWWGDTYWGVCRGVGDNNLGKILMETRNKLRR